jgi:integrase
MANYSKTPTGRWKAQLFINNRRMSKTFDTKFLAGEWAKKTELELRMSPDDSHLWTMEQVLEKYRDEVTVTKKGTRFETITINRWLKEKRFDCKLSEISSKTIIDFRDERLKTIKGSSCKREMTLLSSIFGHCVKEWQILDRNPSEKVKRPPDSKRKQKLISQAEIDQFLAQIPYTGTAGTTRDRAGIAFLFAIETAMRMGEICKLRKSDIVGRTAKLYDTKNGEDRNVPLSKKAIELLSILPTENLFDLTSGQLDYHFRSIRDEAKLDFNFHMTRHLAVTRLAKKLQILDLAEMTGHKKLNELMTYYKPESDRIADQLG